MAAEKRALDDAASEVDRVLLGEKSEVSEGLAQDEYRVRLPCFEGPLDLLLHLIRKEQLNIYDIPVSKICQSYLEHLELMQQLDFNVAGEFMVMASTLIYLKSALMLPNENEDLGEDDPRKPLVAQLLEYERFKKAAHALDAIPWLNRDYYTRPLNALTDTLPEEALLTAPLEPIDQFQLLVQLKIILDRTERPAMTISIDTTSLKDKVVHVSEFLEREGTVEFSKLLPENRRRQDIILTFMAILELAKLKFIEIVQTENFGVIQIRAVKPMRELNYGLLDQY